MQDEIMARFGRDARAIDQLSLPQHMKATRALAHALWIQSKKGAAVKPEHLALLVTYITMQNHKTEAWLVGAKRAFTPQGAEPWQPQPLDGTS